MSNPIVLSLDEDNKIEFGIAVRGTTSNLVGAPSVRFIISEKRGGMAVVLPAKLSATSNDSMVVNIPPLKHVFSENQEYVGKIEIIVGDKYFSPTSMDISFTKALEIETATPVSVRQGRTSSPKPAMVMEHQRVNESEVEELSAETLYDEDIDFDSVLKPELVARPKKSGETNLAAAKALWEERKRQVMGEAATITPVSKKLKKQGVVGKTAGGKLLFTDADGDGGKELEEEQAQEKSPPKPMTKEEKLKERLKKQIKSLLK